MVFDQRSYNTPHRKLVSVISTNSLSLSLSLFRPYPAERQEAVGRKHELIYKYN